jgi:hypothetical protein
MTICPHCGAGDQRLRPGSIASGTYCQGCGTRLVPQPPTTEQKLAQDDAVIVADVNKLRQALEANKTLIGSLYEARNQLTLAKVDLGLVTQERDHLKVEIAAIKAALASAGLPEPPVAAPGVPQAPAVDFHGVPLTTEGKPQLASGGPKTA